jgi:hypothetical protein
MRVWEKAPPGGCCRRAELEEERVPTVNSSLGVTGTEHGLPALAKLLHLLAHLGELRLLLRG